MKKLAIVGTHKGTRNNAPFDDPDVDIWVFNESAQTTPEFYPNEPDKQWCTRWDAVIQLHKKDVYQSPTNWVNPRHWEWLQRDHGDKVIWLQEDDENVPNGRKYPLDEIIATVPGASLQMVYVVTNLRGGTGNLSWLQGHWTFWAGHGKQYRIRVSVDELCILDWYL